MLVEQAPGPSTTHVEPGLAVEHQMRLKTTRETERTSLFLIMTFIVSKPTDMTHGELKRGKVTFSQDSFVELDIMILDARGLRFTLDASRVASLRQSTYATTDVCRRRCVTRAA